MGLKLARQSKYSKGTTCNIRLRAYVLRISCRSLSICSLLSCRCRSICCRCRSICCSSLSFCFSILSLCSLFSALNFSISRALAGSPGALKTVSSSDAGTSWELCCEFISSKPSSDAPKDKSVRSPGVGKPAVASLILFQC